jgi:hypothetical protein
VFTVSVFDDDSKKHMEFCQKTDFWHGLGFGKKYFNFLFCFFTIYILSAFAAKLLNFFCCNINHLD